MTIIEFMQHFLQGLWFDSDALLQLPGFSNEVVKNYRRSIKEHGILESSITTFCKLTPEKRKNMNLIEDKVKYE